MKVKFKRFSSCARISQKATTGSTCYDLFSARCITLEPNATRLIWDFLSQKSTWR